MVLHSEESVRSMDNEDGFSPAGISFVGALSVILFYWIYAALVSTADIMVTGVEITVFVSAFLSQYIPLALLKDELQDGSRSFS